VAITVLVAPSLIDLAWPHVITACAIARLQEALVQPAITALQAVLLLWLVQLAVIVLFQPCRSTRGLVKLGFIVLEERIHPLLLMG